MSDGQQSKKRIESPTIFPGDLTVPGFEEQYGEYVRCHRNPYWFLFLVGWAIVGAGMITISFGRSSIMVSVFTESSLFQVVQLHPLLTGYFGIFVLGVAAWIDISNSPLTPEAYLCEHYEWVPADESIPMDPCVYYVVGDIFFVHSDEEEADSVV